MSRVLTGISFVVLLVIAAELAIGEAFLVSARPFGTSLPIAALLAAVGNLVIGLVGERMLRHPAGAALPGLVWLVIVIPFGSRRGGEGIVVPGTFRGLAFYLAGTAAAATVVGIARAKKVASPPDDSGR